MAEVIPFSGIRYNPSKIKDLASVITPPYDVISGEAQKGYYEKSPYNIIRLELGYQNPGDNEQENRYTRAAKFYKDWLNQGILQDEKSPSFYLYEQEFQVNGQSYQRTGFFARVLLEDYAKGNILPHEATLAKPKADRLALMHACKTNFSSVFSIYDDQEKQVDRTFGEIKKNPPDADLVDEFGERHRLWVVADQEICKMITANLKDKVLYIADGHHRYDTALTFSRSMGEKYQGTNYVLMYLVNMHDLGLVVLPTHRIVHSLQDFDLAFFKENLKHNFSLQEINSETGNITETLKKQQEDGKTSFIMKTAEPKYYLLTLKDPLAVKKLLPQKPDAWCTLDVSVLQVLILQELLGINTEKAAAQENLEYTQDENQALNAVSEGKAQLAFILNSTKIEEILAVARAGATMPQKSTYFYPKLVTGLVFNDLTHS